MKEPLNLVASIRMMYGMAMRELLVSNDLDKMRAEAAFARKALEAASTPEGIMKESARTE
jgi:hypothetical protein